MNNFNEETTYAFGCVPSVKDLRDYKINPDIAFAVQLPVEYKVPISEIKNQGGVCSCVAHAVCEVLEAENENKEKYSTNWIYGYRPFGYMQGKGMMTNQAIKTTCNVGYVLYDDFKGNAEMDGVRDSVNANLATLKEKAKERKTYSYARLHNREEIKRAIYLTGHPVILCLHCCDPFIVDSNNVLVYSDKFSGYHAMVCYGWNEQGLLLQNSWGEGWANKGCAILPNNYPFSESWLIADSETSFAVVKPTAYGIRKLAQAIITFFITLFSKK